MPAIWVRNKGLLGELQDPAVFLARNGLPYNPTIIAPLSHPVIVAGAITAERKQARAEHAIESTN